MRDPYLIPGAICEVGLNNDNGPSLVRFSYYEKTTGKPSFLHVDKNILIPHKNYRVLNTEWTHAPEWALCSTVDSTGICYFWGGLKFRIDRLQKIDGKWKYCDFPQNVCLLACGICPDKTRYQGDAWKTSLRMRPVWAGGKQ